MIRGELDAALSRPRYGRLAEHAEGGGVTEVVTGHRHGSRARMLTGTFGKTEISVPRARLNTSDGKTKEWKSQSLRNYQRRTLAADALIACAYLSGTNTRRVRRALFAQSRSKRRRDTMTDNPQTNETLLQLHWNNYIQTGEQLGYSTEEAEEMLEEFENPEAVVAKDYERRFGNGAGI
jgi:Transposase, Mutator family